MYVTRPLSLYKKSPEALVQPTPSGPNSGYLVLQDEESTTTTCFGLCENKLITDLPFPQNKSLNIQYESGETTIDYPLFLIPVINLPLSSNQYYAIRNQGKRKGEAYTSSTEEDRQTRCFCISYIRDQKTRELDPNEKLQQFEFSSSTTCLGSTVLNVKSVADDGYPPSFMRSQGWSLWNAEPKHFTLGEANGLNSALRARLPELNFPPSENCSNVVEVGRWYSPFMFVKEGTPKEHVQRCMYYEVTLDQRWERIHYCENNGSKGNIITFDVDIPIQRVTVNGKEAMVITNNSRVGVGLQWFQDYKSEESGVGLSLLVVERMIWEQERVGWSNNRENQLNLARVEEYGGVGSWKSFACYMLVERFVFKRMDGSIALTFDFNHTHQMNIKWDR